MVYYLGCEEVLSSNEIIFSLPLPKSLTSYVTSLDVIAEEEASTHIVNIFEGACLIYLSL